MCTLMLMAVVHVQLPSGQQQQKAPYALTVIPPFILAALFPQIFFKVSALCAYVCSLLAYLTLSSLPSQLNTLH